MQFEWDETKNRTNRLKHGIDFELARLAFGDPFAMIFQDRDTDAEQRYQLLAVVSLRLIVVAYVLRTVPLGGEPAIRIISARKATPLERKSYEENATY